jgi:serine/threonine protein kinase
MLGTMGYLSPEQARGWPADGRSDLFSLGAVLYEMLTGRRAFDGPSDADTISAVLHRDPPCAATASEYAGLERIVRRCLEKEPDDRFQNARDLAFALERLAGPAAEFGLLSALARCLRRKWFRWMRRLSNGFPRREPARRAVSRSGRGSRRKAVSPRGPTSSKS